MHGTARPRPPCRRWHHLLPYVGAVLLMAITRPAPAVEVMLRLVVDSKGGARLASERQSLWWSPFGGFVAETAPFGLRLDDAPILEFRSASEKLLDESAEAQETVAAEAITAERRQPGSQPRLANENVPLLWTQSLTWLADLLLAGSQSPRKICKSFGFPGLPTCG